MATQKWQIVLACDLQPGTHDCRELEKMGYRVVAVRDVTPPAPKLPPVKSKLDAEFLRLRGMLKGSTAGDGTWERFLAVGAELKRRADLQKKSQQELGLEF